MDIDPQFKATDEALKKIYAAMEKEKAMDPEDVYGRVWDDGEFCRECIFLKRWEEHHPCGDTTVPEYMSECVVENIDCCPGVIDYNNRPIIMKES